MISGHCRAFQNRSTVIVKSYPLGPPNVTESYILKYGSTILVDGINNASAIRRYLWLAKAAKIGDKTKILRRSKKSGHRYETMHSQLCHTFLMPHFAENHTLTHGAPESNEFLLSSGLFFISPTQKNFTLSLELRLLNQKWSSCRAV
jgi:hypothetical protein